MSFDSASDPEEVITGIGKSLPHVRQVTCLLDSEIDISAGDDDEYLKLISEHFLDIRTVLIHLEINISNSERFVGQRGYLFKHFRKFMKSRKAV